MKKRVLSIMLALALCLSFVPMAFAAETTTVTLTGETATVTITNVLKKSTITLPESEDPADGTFEAEVLWLPGYGSRLNAKSTDSSEMITEWTFWFLQEDGNYEYSFSKTYNTSSPYEQPLALDEEVRDYGFDSGWLVDRYTYNDVTFLVTYMNEADIAALDDADVTLVMPVAEVPSLWATEEVAAAIEAGLVPENLQENYAKPVSRGDVAQIVINLLEKASGLEIEALLAAKDAEIDEDAFTDTTDAAVLAANALGIINGIGEGKFSPEGTFTRAQMAAIINRIARVLGHETEGFTHEFTDVEGSWVDEELGWPVSKGIINGIGDGKFGPDSALTTEQTILIIGRALPNLELGEG